jgi:glutamate racemase
VTYFSDTGVSPYGKMPRRELISRLNDVIEFLKVKGVTDLIIGCNAASTAIPFLKISGVRITGVIEKAVEAALAENPKRLGLIGGKRTVLSGIYQKTFAAKGVKVNQRIAQPLSALIEDGDISSELFRNEAKKILAPLRTCSHILLACTHYPAAAVTLSELLQNGTKLIDPAEHLVRSIAIPKIKKGADDFFTTGDSDQMRDSAKTAFGIKIGTIRQVKI